jgi:hypothetical protein
MYLSLNDIDALIYQSLVINEFKLDLVGINFFINSVKKGT